VAFDDCLMDERWRPANEDLSLCISFFLFLLREWRSRAFPEDICTEGMSRIEPTGGHWCGSGIIFFVFSAVDPSVSR
jgi:hypothetical protein